MYLYTQGVSESTYASVTTGNRSARPGAWSKRVVPILLMSHGCFFGVLFPLRASCARARADWEQTDLLICEQIARLILIQAMTIHYDMYDIFIFM